MGFGRWEAIKAKVPLKRTPRPKRPTLLVVCHRGQTGRQDLTDVEHGQQQGENPHIQADISQ